MASFTFFMSRAGLWTVKDIGHRKYDSELYAKGRGFSYYKESHGNIEWKHSSYMKALQQILSPAGQEYQACGPGCVHTCDNYEELEKDPDACPISSVDGCTCPKGMVGSYTPNSLSLLWSSSCVICISRQENFYKEWLVQASLGALHTYA